MGLNLFVGPALGIGLAIRAVQDGWGAGALGLCVGLVGLGAAAGSLAMVRWRPRLEAAAGFGWLVVQGARSPSWASGRSGSPPQPAR